MTTPLKIFTEEICVTPDHCANCRNLDGGRSFRLNMAKAFVMPEGGADFACPSGHPWGYVPPPIEAQPQPTTKNNQTYTAIRIPVPRSKWPWGIRQIAEFGQAGERGVGDTIEANLSEGGESFKRLVEAAKKNCGCTNTQIRLNLDYPYPPFDKQPGE